MRGMSVGWRNNCGPGGVGEAEVLGLGILGMRASISISMATCVATSASMVTSGIEVELKRTLGTTACVRYTARCRKEIKCSNKREKRKTTTWSLHCQCALSQAIQPWITIRNPYSVLWPIFNQIKLINSWSPLRYLLRNSPRVFHNEPHNSNMAELALFECVCDSYITWYEFV